MVCLKLTWWKVGLVDVIPQRTPANLMVYVDEPCYHNPHGIESLAVVWQRGVIYQVLWDAWYTLIGLKWLVKSRRGPGLTLTLTRRSPGLTWFIAARPNLGDRIKPDMPRAMPYNPLFSAGFGSSTPQQYMKALCDAGMRSDFRSWRGIGMSMQSGSRRP